MSDAARVGQQFGQDGKLAWDELKNAFGLSEKDNDVCRRVYTAVYTAVQDALADRVKGVDKTCTVHDMTHVNGVLGILARLIDTAPSSEIDLEPGERLELVLGAMVHDVGMWLGPREEHAARGGEWARERLGELGVRSREVVRRVSAHCIYHTRSGELRDVARYDPRRAQLLSLVRLADGCHLGTERVPDDAYEALWRREGVTHTARMYWTVNRTVELRLCDLSASHSTIRLSPLCPVAAFPQIPEFVRRELEDELVSIAGYAPSWLAIRRVELASERLPEQDAWFDWADWAERVVIAGFSVYANAVVEAGSSSEVVAMLADNICALAAQQRRTTSLRARVTRILRHALDLRPQLNSLRTLSDVAMAVSPRPAAAYPRRLTAAVQRFLAFRQRAVEVVADSAPPELQKARRVFVFGYGEPVRQLLMRSGAQPAEGTRLTVLTPCMRPVGEGGRLAILNDATLPMMGVGVQVVPDGQIDCAMGLCDAVVMGCEAVWHDGSITNSAGALAVAAAAARAAKPLYVLTDTTKISPYLSRLRSPIPRLGTMHFVGEESVKRAATGRWPVSEAVPASLVTAVVTDVGEVRPGSRALVCLARQRLRSLFRGMAPRRCPDYAHRTSGRVAATPARSGRARTRRGRGQLCGGLTGRRRFPAPHRSARSVSRRRQTRCAV